MPQRTPEAIRRLKENAKATFTANKEWFENPATNKSVRELRRRIKHLEEQFAEFNTLHQELLVTDENETGEDVAQVESVYFELIAEMETLLDQSDHDAHSIAGTEYRTTGSLISTSGDNVRLPKLAMPEFDGTATKWASFSQRFISAVRSPHLSDLNRLEHLLTCVKGEAAELLENTPLVEENYATAFKALRDRYENKRMLLRLHLQKLFQLPQVNGNSENSLRNLINATKSNVRAIENLQLKRDALSNELLAQLVVSKLDNRTRELWETQLGTVDSRLPIDNENMDSYSELTLFLENRLRVISSVFGADATPAKPKTPAQQPTSSKLQSKAQPKASLALQVQPSPTVTPRICPMCSNSHALYQCEAFKKLSVSERYERVRNFQVCVNCFSKGHWASACSSSKCKQCGRLHHTLLHSPTAPAAVSSQQASVTAPSTLTPTSAAATYPSAAATYPSAAATYSSAAATNPSAAASIITAVAQRRTRDVLLSTAIIRASSGSNVVEARALLDGASHITLITSNLARTLGLTLQRSTTVISGLGGMQSAAVATTTIHISSGDSTFTKKLHATVVEHVTAPLPAIDFEPPASWDFSEYGLANPRFYRSRPVDMLIGADYLYEIMLPEIVRSPSAPTLLASRLGWLVAGPYSANAISAPARCLKVTVDHRQLRAISEFLGLENDSYRSNESRTVDEIACEEFFTKTTERDATGRFIVSLPRRAGITLGESRQKAIALLKRTRIDEQYREFLQEYESLGHMERCAPPLPGQETYYMSHHAVYHNGKIRVVFNASMETTNGVSLNDCLLVGPVVQRKLKAIVLRFRMYLYAFAGDIEKMFRQMRRADKDCDLQRIVQYVNGEIADYKLTTITYGEKSAPYEATRCLVQLAEEGRSEYPEAAEVLREETYMDDSLSGAATLAKAQARRDQTSALLETAGMRFSAAKWRANHPELLLEGASNESTFQLNPGSALGIEWDTARDVFAFTSLVNFAMPPGPATRRSLLSQVSRIFDPLGLLAPLTIAGKLLIQGLWTEELGWDEPVGEKLENQFKELASYVIATSNLTFERYIGCQELGPIELFGFADASPSAYAACVYTRHTQADATTAVRLVTSKTRVAPKAQPRTVPQLELCAADLLVELLVEVTEVLGYPMDKCRTYSDSTVALSYLAKPPGHWKPFVANRVRRITASVPVEQWRHVPGDQNPADLATRADSFAAFMRNQSLWLHGPEFLQNGADAPESQALQFDEAALTEARASVLVITAGDFKVCSESNVVDSIISRCSEYATARSIIAAFLRVKVFLLSRVRNTASPTGEFSVSELKHAELELVKAAQEHAYHQEIGCLQSGKPLQKRSALRSLAPFLNNGVMRVGGRISRADLAFERRHPVILPAAHRLALLLIRDCHLRYFHAGPQFIDSFIRQRHWVVGQLLPRIQKCVRTCARCVRFQRNPQRNPPMADLPAARVRPAYPFVEVGVDYAGPYLRKPEIRSRAATDLKTYVAVFCCFTTRAVHLEAVTELSMAAFLAAFKRFAARRGFPRTLYSDNGTNFTGAAKELHARFAQLAAMPSFNNFATQQGVEWRFNPPAAPHMGGLWEAAVRSMKKHLRRTIGEQRLTFEEFTTVLAQIEAILNSRPICQVPSASAKIDILTPGHFIIGRPLLAVPDNVTDSSGTRVTQRWDLLTQLRNSFWRRWSSEYLDLLQRRVKWQDPVRSHKEGDIVILQDNTPPMTWPLARINRVFPGTDGVVRVVEVQSRNGAIYRRPVSKIVPLVDTESISTAKTSSTAAGC